MSVSERFYVDAGGKFLGCFWGGEPSDGVEVATAPADARQIWDFVAGRWGAVPAADPFADPLSRLTFWLAAAEIGVTKAGIRARIDAMPEGVQKYQALAFLEEAPVYRRADPLLIQMAAAEGISESELDALWTWAAQAYP